MTQHLPPTETKQPSPTPNASSSTSHRWPEEVGQREARKLRARQEGPPTVWFGLGMFGLVGWSVAIPTVAGTLFGVWLDHLWPSRVSWTLTFLFLGLFWGCRQAWYWIEKESQRRATTLPHDPLLPSNTTPPSAHPTDTSKELKR